MPEKKYIEHKYIRPKSIEARLYQQKILASSLSGNTLVVLPTGLGKTIILALLTVRRMEQYPPSFILVVAPTKPLVEQHVKTFQKTIHIIEEEIIMLTGSITPEKRAKLWKQGQIIIATPQVVENDLISNRVDLSRCSLLGVDEAHRAVGDYAYVYIAKEYMKQAKHPLIIAITASPGSKEEKIQEVCKNLAIEHVETRTDSSRDVKPYIQKTSVDWIHVDLPAKFKRIKTLLERSLSAKLKELKNLGWVNSSSVSSVHRRDLLKLPPQITKQFDKTDNVTELYFALGLVGSSIRLTHALELLETQGISSLLKYFSKMEKEAKGTKASKNLIRLLREDALIVSKDIAQQIQSQGLEHPKIPELITIVQQTINESPDSRVLVFTQYRDSAKKLAKILNGLKEINASRFVGQASKVGDKGFSQKKQLEVMQKFREGEFNLLVATSVGEEGLDVSECDLVVFYDCVPSAVRSIQRRGRTGRKREGRVVVLITKGTRDEGYFWASKHKERKMKSNLRELEKYSKNTIDIKQRTIEDFFSASEEEEIIEEDSVLEEGSEFDEIAFASDEALQKLEQTIEQDKQQQIKPTNAEEQAINDFQEQEKKDDTENKIVKIILDSRESKSGLAKELARLDMDVELVLLEVADLIVSSDIGIERKEVEDFSQSIIDGRLFPQLIALKRTYPNPLLIIEGESIYGHKALNPEAIRGAIAAITLNFDIKILWTRSTKDTARFIRTIAIREQIKSDRAPVIRSEKAPVIMSDLQEFIVAGFPNINAVLAKRILAEFQTIESFISASIADLQKVKGIGKKKAEEIKEITEAKYNP